MKVFARISKIYLGLVVAILSTYLIGCKYDNIEKMHPAATCNTNDVSYKNFVKPLIYDSCRSCHYDSTKLLGSSISLQTYAQVKIQVDNQQLLVAMTAPAGSLSSMPQSGPLSDCNYQKMIAWIRAGGPDN